MQLIYNIFGKKNYITTLIWKSKASGSAMSKFATVEHNYIITVAKDIKKAKWNGLPSDKINDLKYDIGKLLFANNQSSRSFHHHFDSRLLRIY